MTISASGSWSASLHTVRGSCQIWAAVAGGSLVAAMVDWDREGEEARRLAPLLASAAELALASGEAQTFPRRCLRELYEALTGPARPPMLDGVSAAAVIAGRTQATAAWMGDVRVGIESAGETWASRDHNAANLAEQDGVQLPEDQRAHMQRVVYKVVGRINPLDIEEHTTAPSPIVRVALCSADVHGYQPLDLDGWSRLGAARVAVPPLDELADGALFAPGQRGS